MNFKLTVLAGIVALGSLGTAAIGQDRAIQSAIEARQATMKLYAFNVGQAAAMAKGDVEYDAEAATAIANNLVALTSLDQSAYWPQGSDTGVLGDATAALPAIWEADSKVGERSMEMAAAAVAFAEAAGGGAEALGAAMGGVGKACNACHQDYRQKN